jgi:hypothetical protein
VLIANVQQQAVKQPATVSLTIYQSKFAPQQPDLTICTCACTRRHRGPIVWRSSLKNTIYDVLKARKDWVETEHETEWDFFWADKG